MMVLGLNKMELELLGDCHKSPGWVQVRNKMVLVQNN